MNTHVTSTQNEYMELRRVHPRVFLLSPPLLIPGQWTDVRTLRCVNKGLLTLACMSLSPPPLGNGAWRHLCVITCSGPHKNLRCIRLTPVARVVLKFHWSVTHQRSHSPLGPSASQDFKVLLSSFMGSTPPVPVGFGAWLQRLGILGRPSVPWAAL